MINIVDLFQLDSLAILMIALVGFVGISIAFFSYRYLKGDAKYGRFYGTLGFLLASVFVMVSADHILLFLVAWGMSNILLTKLMIHKSSWRAAYQSGILAGKNFILGFVMISTAIALLYTASGQTSIHSISAYNYSLCTLIPAATLLFLGAMTQSAIWPFHRWLTSSLNAPTPVSAIMHAGLVNGGGFLLVRFAPLYYKLPNMLTIIFSIGLISALLGTLWKLMQSDIKRMLACSTMGQMGFMIVQCGLGLFPAAIAHLCTHGLFKAYLFLSSGSAAQEKRLDLGYPPRLPVFFLALLCGFVGSVIFALAIHKNTRTVDTTFILIAMTWIAGAQFSMLILWAQPLKKFPLALLATLFLAGLYGSMVYSFENVLAPLHLMQPQPLNSVHIIGLVFLVVAWLAILFARNPGRVVEMPKPVLKLYVKMLNASQPHKKTITTYRNYYQY